jgi:uncharacterized protein (TIGR03083 family)
MGDPDEVDLAGLYRDTRVRLAGLVAELDDAALAAAVPACPGWAVRDVLAHVAAVADDAVAGRITGIPTDEHNAGQVARLAHVGADDLLELWGASASQFEEIIGAFDVWPAVIDVASHEQDIRGAVGRPGARDCDAIRHGVVHLLDVLSVPVALRVVFEDGEHLAGPDGDEAGLTLSTTRFETFRWRMGRRSRAQLAGLCWSGDPALVLDHLCFFGPAGRDIVE